MHDLLWHHGLLKQLSNKANIAKRASLGTTLSSFLITVCAVNGDLNSTGKLAFQDNNSRDCSLLPCGTTLLLVHAAPTGYCLPVPHKRARNVSHMHTVCWHHCPLKLLVVAQADVAQRVRFVIGPSSTCYDAVASMRSGLKRANYLRRTGTQRVGKQHAVASMRSGLKPTN